MLLGAGGCFAAEVVCSTSHPILAAPVVELVPCVPQDDGAWRQGLWGGVGGAVAGCVVTMLQSTGLGGDRTLPHILPALHRVTSLGTGGRGSSGESVLL